MEKSEMSFFEEFLRLFFLLYCWLDELKAFKDISSLSKWGHNILATISTRESKILSRKIYVIFTGTLGLPNQKAELKMNNELSHTILHVNLVELP
jgi:hypothetical protein